MASVTHLLFATHTQRMVLATLLTLSALVAPSAAVAATGGTISQAPMFLANPVAPISMIAMPKDQSLFKAAYSDYSDLDGDGVLDTTYKDAINYVGYFDYGLCYDYSGGQFIPKYKASGVNNHYCNGQWSGNLLNWVTMSRMDIVRWLLYGGKRVTDTSTTTVLQRAYIPPDAHAWAKYYNGADIGKLTPFSNTNTNIAAVKGRMRDCTTAHMVSGVGWVYDCDPINATFPAIFNNSPTVGGCTGGSTNSPLCEFHVGSSDFALGDQVKVYPGSVADPNPGTFITGVVVAKGHSTRSNEDTVSIRFDKTSTPSVGPSKNWMIEDLSRTGISFCNTTFGSGLSQDNKNAPQMLVVKGNYALWAANGGTQCHWYGKASTVDHTNKKQLSGFPGQLGSNGNQYALSGLKANAENPVRSEVGLGATNGQFNVNIVACYVTNSELLAVAAQCKKYPDGNFKPAGLLQKYGDNGQIKFGLVTGSYPKNYSGGVLRANADVMHNEIHTNTDGRFKNVLGIVSNLDNIRIYGFKNDNIKTGNHYGDGDNCTWQISNPLKHEGSCQSWGNPFSEIYLEALRYLAGQSPTPDFHINTPVSGNAMTLSVATWDDPLSHKNYCAPLDILAFNTGVATADHDQMGGLSDLGATASAAQLTTKIGDAEHITGKSWFVGNTASVANALCSAKDITDLGSVYGLCPAAPSLKGSYLIAGAAWWAHTHRIRSDLGIPNAQNNNWLKVHTFGVQLAAGTPKINVSVGDKTVTILPSYLDHKANDQPGALVDFKVIHRDSTTASYYINWEDSVMGGDYDQDMWGVLSYAVNGNKITVTTQIIGQSTSGQQGFGFSITGTTQDGVHFLSGIEGFTYSDPTGADACNNCQYGDSAKSYTFTAGNSSAQTLQKPLYYAAKWGGFTDTNDNQRPDKTGEWDANGDGIPDNYFYATNPLKLKSALDKALQHIAAQVASATSVAANSTELRTNTLLYQAQFKSGDWFGKLLAYDLDAASQTIASTPAWNATDKLDTYVLTDKRQRNIYTWVPISTTGAGAEFFWPNLSTNQKSDLENNEDILDWLRGVQGIPGMRVRTHLLGDIVNSNPVYVGHPDFRYYMLPCPAYRVPCTATNPAPSTTYEGSDFRSGSDYTDRPSILYVGANDGMLHAFDAKTGQPLFAYIPSAVYPRLAQLSEPSYSSSGKHLYYVDGQIAYGDAHFQAADESQAHWHTALIGTLGGGGKGVFALDITAPVDANGNVLFDKNNVLWEYDADTLDDKDLGYTFGKPAIIRLKDGYWYAMFNNGYASTNHTAVLYLIRLDTTDFSVAGKVIKINTGSTCAYNGLSAANPVDVNADRVTDYVYAGDLCGNLWKFDFRSTGTTAASPTVTKLFSATESASYGGDAQPITERPAVGRNPRGGYMIYFGTGRYLYNTDNKVKSDGVRNTFYAIWDNGSGNTINRTQLQKQTISKEVTINNSEARVVSKHSVDYASGKMGWKMDLVSPTTTTGTVNYEGERVVANPILRFGHIIFTTMIPTGNQEPCQPGGTGWLMELDALSGGRINHTVLDVNGDGKLDDGDTANGSTPVSGTKSGIGVISSPGIITDPNNPGKEYKYLSGSSGEIEVIEERGRNAAGRISWRQIQ